MHPNPAPPLKRAPYQGYPRFLWGMRTRASPERPSQRDRSYFPEGPLGRPNDTPIHNELGSWTAYPGGRSLTADHFGERGIVIGSMKFKAGNELSANPNTLRGRRGPAAHIGAGRSEP
jgi:hypothetical protein